MPPIVRQLLGFMRVTEFMRIRISTVSPDARDVGTATSARPPR
jgi:hypothetical protein